MAKRSKSVSFKNAIISVEDDTITEIMKDDSKTYKLSDTIAEWNEVEGISITIKKESDIESE